MDTQVQQEQEIVSLNEICRTCLIKTDNMRQLLYPNEEIIELITKLSTFINMEIELSDTLPCYLCQTCEEKLKISYDFQQLCQKSQHFIQACVSVTNSVSSKVNNIFKPIQLEDTIDKIEIEPEQQLENNSSSFIDFSNTDINTKSEDSLITYNEPVTDAPVSSNKVDILNHLPNNKKVFLESMECPVKHDEKNNENFVKPAEVGKRSKNQTMRLPQFSKQEVDKIITRVKERFFKHRNCLYCGFTATDTRSLSVHMTRLHKELKDQWCVWCNKLYDDLQRHLKEGHVDDFTCPLCDQYKSHKGHFLEHLACHSIERKYECELCKKTFVSRSHLKSHYRIHTDKPFTCEVCTRGFLLMKSLKAHLKSHVQCSLCEEYFKSEEEMKEHKCGNTKDQKDNKEEKSELREDVFRLENNSKAVPQNYCDQCDRKVRSLQSHIQRHHSPQGDVEKKAPSLLCTYCGKQFRTRAKLTVHVRTHTGEQPYKCSYCDKRMSTRMHVVSHERTHTGEKPYICKICGKGFSQSSVLNVHMKLHTGRPEECHICSKRFCRPSELRQHMRKHTGEKPYKCDVCDQAFIQSSHLVEHQKTHSDVRPYKCQYCDKNFKAASTLKAHVNIHLGKKPYKCTQCSYACRQSYSLNQHMLQHENNVSKSESVFRCDVCEVNFTTQALFSTHFESSHGVLSNEGNADDDALTIKDIMEGRGMPEEIVENIQLL